MNAAIDAFLTTKLYRSSGRELRANVLKQGL